MHSEAFDYFPSIGPAKSFISTFVDSNSTIVMLTIKNTIGETASNKYMQL